MTSVAFCNLSDVYKDWSPTSKPSNIYKKLFNSVETQYDPRKEIICSSEGCSTSNNSYSADKNKNISKNISKNDFKLNISDDLRSMPTFSNAESCIQRNNTFQNQNSLNELNINLNPLNTQDTQLQQFSRSLPQQNQGNIVFPYNNILMYPNNILPISPNQSWQINPTGPSYNRNQSTLQPSIYSYDNSYGFNINNNNIIEHYQGYQGYQPPQFNNQMQQFNNQMQQFNNQMQQFNGQFNNQMPQYPSQFNNQMPQYPSQFNNQMQQYPSQFNNQMQQYPSQFNNQMQQLNNQMSQKIQQSSQPQYINENRLNEIINNYINDYLYNYFEVIMNKYINNNNMKNYHGKNIESFNNITDKYDYSWIILMFLFVIFLIQIIDIIMC